VAIIVSFLAIVVFVKIAVMIIEYWCGDTFPPDEGPFFDDDDDEDSLR
jgi:hypothetical protein